MHKQSVSTVTTTFALTALIVLGGLIAAPTQAQAAAGSGTASISPSGTVTVDETGTWTIVYTFAEPFVSGGTVRLTIPTDWTLPQDVSSIAPGYVTVMEDDSEGTATPTISGYDITIAVDTMSAGSQLTIKYGDDSGGSSARAVAPQVPGNYTFVVASDPAGASVVTLTDGSSPVLTVTSGQPFKLQILPADTTVTADELARYRVNVLDFFDNPTPVTQERIVRLAPSSGLFYDTGDPVTPITDVTLPVGTQSFEVDYRGTLATSGTPHNIFMFTSDPFSPSLLGVTGVSVNPGAVDATQSEIAAVSPVTAGGVPSNVTVTARDTYGNLVPNVTVTLAATASATPTQPGSPTNASGTAVGTVSDDVAEIVTVRATVDGDTLTSTATVEFLAGVVDAATSTVAAVTPRIADGSDQSTITVTARDALGNPVAGQTVTLSINPTGNGATLVQPGGVTDANGQITGSLASTTTGDREVSATIGATLVTQTATVSFVPAPLGSYQWSVDGAGIAGQFENVTITAFDTQGNIKTDYTGTVLLTTTSTGTGDGEVQWDAVSPDAEGTVANNSGDNGRYRFVLADNGVATIRVTKTKAESFQVMAADSAASSVNATSDPIVIDNASASTITPLAGDGQNATVNTAVATPVRVRVSDQFDNDVDGETVTFRVVAGGGSVASGGTTDSTAVTGANGEIDCDVWTLGTTVGTNTLRALIGAGDSTDFTATGTPGPGATLTLLPGSGTVTVGATRPMTALLIDAFGNAVPGERVDVLIKSPANGTLAQGAGSTSPTSPTSRFGNTDAAGEIRWDYIAPGVASVQDTITAFSTNVSVSANEPVYTTTASGATDLRITFLTSTTAAAGANFQFRIDAIDGNQNVVPGATPTVTLTPGGGGVIFSETSDFAVPVTQVTLAAGTATVFGRGFNAGDWSITADDGLLTPDAETVTITDDGTVVRYDVNTVASVTAGQSFNVTVTARDQYDNRVMGAGETVNLTARQDADSTQSASASLLVGQAALVSGQVVVGEQYTVAEDIRVRADFGGNEGFSGTLAVSAAAAERIEKVTTSIPVIAAGADQDLTVRVLDPYDNFVQGETVTFAVTGGGGSMSPGPHVTGVNGEVTATLTTGSTAGVNGVKATIDDENPASLERVDFTVNTEAGLVSYYTVVPAKLNIDAGEVINVTVTAYDGNDNVLTNDNTTSVDLSATSLNVNFGVTPGTLTAGVYTTTVSDNIAESFQVIAATSGSGVPSDTSSLVNVNNGPEWEIVPIAGDTTGIPVTTTRDLTVEARDQFGNTVENAIVTFFLDPPGGPDGTASIVGDGIELTDAQGRATVTLQTAETAGTNTVRARILDGTPAREITTFTVSTVAGNIDHYVVLLDATQQTAGIPVTVTVRAFDATNNLVDDNATSVALTAAPDNTPAWGANPVVLQAGTLQTTVTLNTTATYTISANTVGQPAINGSSPLLTIVPAAPALAIGGVAVPDTIAANNQSTSVITSSVITDAFGNTVSEGELITVVPSLGDIITADQNPGTAENDQAVDATGRITFQLRSSTTVGTSNVAMNSVNGSASGSLPVEFAQVPAFVCTDVADPHSVIIGDTAAFKVVVTNTSATGVTLNPSTTMSFTDGSTPFTANLAVAQFIEAGVTDTLFFAPTPIDPAITPAGYQPVLSLSGLDTHGASFSGNCTMPPNSVYVTAVEITSISAPAQVLRDQNVTVIVTVNNPSAQDATVTSVGLSFPNGTGDYNVGVSPDIGMLIPAGSPKALSIPVYVVPTSGLGVEAIDANVQVLVAGQPASDNSLAPYGPLPTWTVLAGATLEYMAGSLTPTQVSIGQTHGFSAIVRNTGGATVTLDTASTITFDTYTAKLEQSIAIPGDSATQTLQFRSLPVSTSPGNFTPTLTLSGKENGVDFSDSFDTGADQVVVQVPAVVNYGNNLSPTQVSSGSSVPFSVDVNNAGGATVLLDPANTTLSFDGGNFVAALTSPASIGLGITTLQFAPTTVSTGITPGTYFPDLAIQGTENGQPFAGGFTLTDGVVVQAAPDLSILSITPSQPKITADRPGTITLTMRVQNNGGATVDFVDASVRFILGGIDRTGEYIVTPPTAFEGGASLAAGIDSLVFTVSDNAGNASIGNLTIEGDLEVVDPNDPGNPIFADTDFGGKGSLLVESQANIQILAVLPSQPKVTQGMTTPITIRVPIRNNGGSDVDLNLTSTSTFLSFSPSAGWAVDDAVLAGGGNTLSGGETDTLVFNVTNSGANTGLTSIDATAAGTELNNSIPVSGTSGGVGLGSVLVQSPGDITINSITLTPRNTFTDHATVRWFATVQISNSGDSDVAIDLGATTANFPTLIAPPGVTLPLVLDDGDTILEGNTSDSFTIEFDGTGDVNVFGPSFVQITVNGAEVNSNESRADNENATLTFQRVPVLEYTPASLAPPIVSLGSTASFTLEVTNTAIDGATATLDRATSTLSFGSGPDTFVAGLQSGSPITITAGSSVTLLFEAQSVSSNLSPGPRSDVQLMLNWFDNGQPGADTRALSGELTLQNQSQLNIVSITPSQPSVTQGQGSPWTITMELQNSGSADIDLDLSGIATGLTLNRLADGTAVTTEYGIQPPTGLTVAGGTVLASGNTDTLVFPVTSVSSGAATGAIIVSGFVSGQDVNTSELVSDNTGDGGTGGFETQTPADIEILSIVSSAATATVNQSDPTAVFTVAMTVRNNGGSAVELASLAANAALSFDIGTGWVATPRAALDGGGTILDGGETDVVTFDVTQVGNTAGTVTIDGQISGLEINTGDPLGDSSAGAGAGTIAVQAPGALVVDSVVPSTSPVTAGSSAPWQVTVTVTNTGNAAVDMDLPATTFSIDGGTPAFSRPPALQGGGVRIGDGETRSFIVAVTNTGPFTAWGDRTINVTVNGNEVNTGNPVSNSGSGSVRVEKEPVLNVLSISPSTVSRGSAVFFDVVVTNADPFAATARLQRAGTRLYFGGSYSAFLDLSSDDVIAGGDTDTLRFEQKVVDPATPLGTTTVNVDMPFLENLDAPGSSSDTININVQAASQLEIVSIVPTQDPVTAGDNTQQWTVQMTVRNNGGAVIDLDFASNKTFLDFDIGGAPDVTYQIQRPTALQSGDTTLAGGGATGVIEFLVMQTGVQSGNVTINGRVEGIDTNSTLTVVGTTASGGRGGVTVQTPAVVSVARISTSRATVTAGQTEPWFVRVVLQNTGQSDVTVDVASSTIEFDFGGATGYSVDPATFAGGPVLEGGSVDSLAFRVTLTGEAGSPTISADVPWSENNTLRADTAQSTAPNAITVQSQPSLKLVSTTLVAPNDPFVNVGQKFFLEAAVTNNGAADAVNVALNATSDANVTFTQPLPIAVAAADTDTVLIEATAGIALGVDTLRVSITGGEDANSNNPSLVLFETPDDSTAAVTVQTPAVLAVNPLATSQATVTRNQTIPWQILVPVENTSTNGGATLTLDVPSSNDVTFRLNALTQVDYAVAAPTGFLSGATDWKLASGAVDTLVYTVNATGDGVGDVDITVDLTGSDDNNAAALQESNTGVITVEQTAGVFIDSTFTLNTYNTTGNVTRVNTQWPYQIRVKVNNTGEALDSVNVNLVSDAGSPSGISGPTNQSYIQMEPDETAFFDFNILSPSGALQDETFTATITKAKSRNTQLPVTPQPARDGTQVVDTQIPSDLQVTLMVTNPPGATVVSTEQQFTISATVTRTGESPLSGTGVLRLTPATLFTPPGQQTRPFTIGTPVEWTFTAPGLPQAADDFTVELSTYPTDVNTNAPVASSQPIDTYGVTVSEGGALTAQASYLEKPANTAFGDTLSDGQSVTVHASVFASATADSVIATIDAPGFTIVGSNERFLGAGGDTLKTTFGVLAPSAPPVSNPAITVKFSGVDVNSGDDLPFVTSVINATIVPRARLTANARIDRPDAALDSTVAIGSEFTIAANVSNVQDGADLLPGAQLTLTKPASYQITVGAATQNFTIGNDVFWTISAPQSPSGPDAIVITIGPATPLDENSGAAATINTGQVSIPIVTEGAAVEARNVTDALGIESRVVQGGARNIDKLGIELKYTSNDLTVSDARVDTIAVRVLGDDGQLLGPGVTRNTLRRVYVVLAGARVYETLNPTTNPVMIDLTGGPGELIAAGDSVTAVVGVDLDPSPSAEELRLQVNRQGLRVKDSASNQLLGVTDRTGQPIDGQLTSSPLVMLSGEFEEYVHNYPNPFSPTRGPTRITYFLDAPGAVSMKIYSLTGNLVHERNIPTGDALATAGPHELEWDGRNDSGQLVRNGIYVCVINAGPNSARFRIAVAK